jgi:mono/diheme cytochrome c family protein
MYFSCKAARAATLKLFSRKFACTALSAGFALNPLALVAAEAQVPAVVEEHWGLLNDYCVSCHNSEDWAGSVDFGSLSPETIANNTEVFEAAMRKLRGRLMPPPGNERPSEAQIDAFVADMEGYLDTIAASHKNPGHIAVHRLNRKEYENAVEDLLAVKIDAADLLPPDTSAEGFDNVAEVLQVSPSFLEQYLTAARAVSMLAVGEEAPPPEVATYEAPSLATQYRHVEGLPLGTRGGFSVEHYFPAAGEYTFNIEIASQEGSLQRSYPQWWLQSEHQFILTIDGEEVYTNKLGGLADEEAVDRIQTPAITEIQNRFMGIKVPVSAGYHTIASAFIQRSHAESDRIVDTLSPGEGQDNIPVIVQMKAFGPTNPVGVPDIASRGKIFTCYPSSDVEQETCATQILSTLARQAFRRPVTDADMAPLLQFYQSGLEQGGFDMGIQKGIMAILGSTKFLYRAEPLPDGAQPGEVFPITDLELASRLSFFLWSTGPDEELIALAEQNKLSEPAVLQAQVRRMLQHPKAEALTQNFAWQWLKIGDIDALEPDPRLFPEYDKDLRSAFKQELALFVDSILRSDRSVLDLLSSNETFINERLARHYGIDDERGSQFRKVTLADERRWGLLGKGGVLLLTSYPNRTSPVLRGAYILETLIGTPPAAPPPGVEIDLDTKPGEAITTVRQRLEAHRVQPSCNQCHGVIDPMGIALENFDAIGLWRDVDRYAAQPIDSQGRTVSGQPMNGPADLRAALMARPDQFVWAMTEKLMVFALGRTVEHYDMPIVRNVARRAAENGYRFEEIVMGVVESDAFRMKSLPVEEESLSLAEE